MRAVWYERNGPAHEVLKVGELPVPSSGPGEVRIRVAYSGVNPSDVKRRSGWGAYSMDFPRIIPNNDGAGTIDQVGVGVDAERLGERVWVHSTGYKKAFGTAAEYAVVPAENAVRLPDATSFELGAGLGVPALTAHACVHAQGAPRASTIMVTGGAGSVGACAIQLAKFGGARVLASVSSAEKAEVAKAAGADEVINYKEDDLLGRVLEFTCGQGIDRLIDVDFAAHLPLLVSAVKQGGSVSTYASMSDPEPKLPFYKLLVRNLTLRWVYVYELPRASLDAAYRDIAAWLVSGSAHQRIARIFELDAAADAHRLVEAAPLGKVLIKIGGEELGA